MLQGLSQPLPALSFEYLPAALEVALAALRRLAELGDYRCNVTLGEGRRWLWPEWRGSGATLAWLAGRRAAERSGDVWARLERSDDARGASRAGAAAPARAGAARGGGAGRGGPVLSLLWSLPAEPAALTPGAFLVVAGEIVLLLALLALVPPLCRGRAGRLVRYGFGFATALAVLLTVADLLIRASLARPLNPLLDLQLAASLASLLTGTLGGALGWLSLAGLAALPPLPALLGMQALA